MNNTDKRIIASIIIGLLLMFSLIFFLGYKPEANKLDYDCYNEIQKVELNKECMKFNSSAIDVFYQRGQTRTLVCIKDSLEYEEIILIPNFESIEDFAEERCTLYKAKESWKFTELQEGKGE